MNDAEVQAPVINYWFYQDLSVRQIAPLVGLQKTRVAEIISDYRKSDPTIDEAKASVQLMKKKNLKPRDLPRVAVFKGKLDELGVDTEYLPGCIKLLEVHGDKAGEVLKWALKLQVLEESTGKSSDEIVRQRSALAAEIKPLVEKKDALVKQIREMENKLPSLQGLSDLQDELNELHVTLDVMKQYVALQRALTKLGFTGKSAEILARALAKSGMNPQQASEKLARDLVNHDSLEEEIQSQESLLKELQTGIAAEEKVHAQWNENIAKAKTDFRTVMDSISKERDAAIAENKEIQKEHDRVENEWNEKVENLKKQSAEISSEINFGNAFRNLTCDPRHLTIPDVDEIIGRLQQVKYYKLNGQWNLSDSQADFAKTDLVRGLIEIVHLQIVTKSDYDILKGQNEDLLKEKTDLKTRLERVAPEINKVHEDFVSLQDDYTYAKNGRTVADGTIRMISNVIAGSGVRSSGVYYKCPFCRAPAQPLNESNFIGTLTFTCSRCERPSNPSLWLLYESTMKLTLGMDSMKTN